MSHEEIVKKLAQETAIEVRGDIATRTIYSVDASIYEVLPIAVAIPKDEREVAALVRAASDLSLPITARGAATGITGGAIGSGIVIDTSIQMNNILSVDYEREWVSCQPGVVQDDLNSFLEKRGYRLGPDTSTGNRATIGGMVGNNAAGARSLFYGKMVDHLLEVKMVLATGEVATFESVTYEKAKELSNGEGTLASIYEKILSIKERYEEEIEKKFPKLPRRVSGYNLDALVRKERLNLSELIAGSEGTLGVITEVKLRIVKRPKMTALLLLFLDDVEKGFCAIEEILATSPFAFEMIDDKIIERGKSAPSMAGKLDWLKGSPKAIFAVEYQGESREELAEKIEALEAYAREKKLAPTVAALYDESEMAKVWVLRKAGLGLLLAKRAYSRAIAFIEDLSVPPKNLASFMKSFLQLLKRHGKEAGIYGHIGAGCMHIRPYIDLRDPKELKLMKEIMVEVTSLVMKEGGTLSGEHGDGYIRSWLNERLFGKKLYNALVEVKEAFDSKYLMNPGKIVRGTALLNNLRLSPERKQLEIETFLDFEKEGGFSLSADLCNGNASCRKSEQLMCPPFQATKRERDTTRARAQMLRAIVNGRLAKEELSGKALYDIMDLCIECKGCKKECPSSVDMAKMKSEHLYHYHKRWGIPIRGWLFGHIEKVNRFTSPLAPLFNRAAATKAARALLPLFGIAKERTLPTLAARPFSKQKKRKTSKNPKAPAVTLFVDTHSEYNRPELPLAACALLERIGYRPQTVERSCCGRPLISKGLLVEARAAAEKIVMRLINAPRPIIVLEPSCLSALVDDFHFLLTKEFQKKWQEVAPHCLSLEEFLLRDKRYELLLEEISQLPEQKIYLHGHCHQKASSATLPAVELLKKFPNHTVVEIASGCCGLAGSFGYEKEHYPLSMAIGNLKLFPAVDAMEQEALLIANGFSCQCQIAHGTARKALHLAEFLRDRLHSKNRLS